MRSFHDPPDFQHVRIVDSSLPRLNTSCKFQNASVPLCAHMACRKGRALCSTSSSKGVVYFVQLQISGATDAFCSRRHTPPTQARRRPKGGRTDYSAKHFHVPLVNILTILSRIVFPCFDRQRMWYQHMISKLVCSTLTMILHMKCTHTVEFVLEVSSTAAKGDLLCVICRVSGILGRG